MNKRERLNRIMQMINENGTINNNEIIKELEVSDMTIRRDLDELEKAGKLLRFHGGAQSINYNLDFELSHLEKATVNIEQKKEIARQASRLVEDGDTIYLGPGTTVEIMANMLGGRPLTVVTNSLPVFNMLTDKGETKVILTGGELRSKTGCFVGPIARTAITSIFYDKAFFSCNGISMQEVTTFSMDEGEIQSLALKNSKNRYLLADLTKFNHQDTFIFYNLSDLDGVITNGPVPEAIRRRYETFCRLIEIS